MSQRLVLPINDLIITANYKNPLYLAQWKFNHFGMDCISAKSRTVGACGNGEVVACGQDGDLLSGPTARLGNVVVIVYKDVLCSDGVTRDLTSRMFHFDKLLCKVGDKVIKGTVVGLYGNTGHFSSGAHLHIEFDSDTKHPCNAYGIASGGKVINTTESVLQYGLSDLTVNPSKIWFVDSKQSIKGATPGWYTPQDVAIPAVPPEKPKEPDWKTLYFQLLQETQKCLPDGQKRLEQYQPFQ